MPSQLVAYRTRTTISMFSVSFRFVFVRPDCLFVRLFVCSFVCLVECECVFLFLFLFVFPFKTFWSGQCSILHLLFKYIIYIIKAFVCVSSFLSFKYLYISDYIASNFSFFIRLN